MPGARFRIRTFMILTASLTLMLSTVRSLAFTHELADLPFLALLYVAIVIVSNLSALLESIKRGLGWIRMMARRWGELRGLGSDSRTDPKLGSQESVG
jgi:hypothetical protein